MTMRTCSVLLPLLVHLSLRRIATVEQPVSTSVVNPIRAREECHSVSTVHCRCTVHLLTSVNRAGTGAAGSIASGEAPIVTCPGWCVIAAVNESLDVIGVGIPKRLLRRTSTDGRAADATKLLSFCASLCAKAYGRIGGDTSFCQLRTIQRRCSIAMYLRRFSKCTCWACLVRL